MQCAKLAAVSLAGIVILIRSPLSGHLYTFIPYCECYFVFSHVAATEPVPTPVQTALIFRTATFAALVRPGDSAIKCVLFFSPSPDTTFTST